MEDISGGNAEEILEGDDPFASFPFLVVLLFFFALSFLSLSLSSCCACNATVLLCFVSWEVVLGMPVIAVRVRKRAPNGRGTSKAVTTSKRKY